jgi:uncharacterized protein (DUF2235 family)
VSKNIVILLDGTSNSISETRTNVLRLYGALRKGDGQLVYYDPGVGTLGGDGAWSGFLRKSQEIWGLATGWGLDRNVKEAYRFIVENYDDGKSSKTGERDRIYIFGFSRGAYSARVLAGFIHAVGLIAPRNLNLLDYAYRAYKRVGENEKAKAFEEVRLYERILEPDRVPIRMLGLFDTVASVIESGPRGLRLKSHAFTSRNTSVQTVSHAVALDERRTMFRPQLWPVGQEYWGNPFNSDAAVLQDVKEVWFAGGHGDVGGGYPEEQSALCKVPLVWMIDRAKECGLQFSTASINSLVYGKRKGSKYLPPDPLGGSHDTMTLGWSFLEFIPRRKPKDSKRWSVLAITLPLFEPRHIPADAKIHESVRARQSELGYSPVNLPSEMPGQPGHPEDES